MIEDINCVCSNSIIISGYYLELDCEVTAQLISIEGAQGDLWAVDDQ